MIASSPLPVQTLSSCWSDDFINVLGSQRFIHAQALTLSILYMCNLICLKWIVALILPAAELLCAGEWSWWRAGGKAGARQFGKISVTFNVHFGNEL